MSHQEAASRTGDNNKLTTNKQQVAKKTAHKISSAEPLLESYRQNLLYSKDLGFLPMRKDPRYTLN